jgi:hypothetical protein
VLSGENITLNSPGFEFSDVQGGTFAGFIGIGVGNVTLTDWFIESTSPIVNAKWGFVCANTGPHGSPQTHLSLRSGSVNVEYAGRSPDQALIRANINTSTSWAQWIDINGVEISQGGNAGWNTLFNLYNSATSSAGPIILNIENVDEFNRISSAATGTANSGDASVAQLRGHYRGTMLNHKAVAPAAGKPFTWFWQPPAASFAN